jgi:serine/threonine protein kinase
MFCSRCGSEVSQPTQYCPTCGLDLRGTTPAQAIMSAEVTEQQVVAEALGSEYQIIEELGRGGMAIVYRAREKQLDREVAIKVLPFSLAFDAEFVERFEREARTAAALEHPNIIPIYRVGKSGRVTYFIMKFLRGRSLSRILVERRRLPPAEIKRILLEVGHALGYAAKRGIVHRDIKPDNIMFDEFGQCVVADFGIAKAASGQKLTGTGMSIGTPHYMSPEQARAQAIDGRSDIYSLGVVAYQCLTGQVPFDGEDSFAIGYKHIMDPLPVPTLATAEERRLFEVIKRMLMKDPRDRFQDSDELIYVLEGNPLAPLGSAARALVQAPRGGITSQPTTPIPGLAAATGVSAEGARRSVPRNPQASESSGGWGWLVGLVVLGLAAAGGYLLLRPRMAAVTAPPVAPVASAPTDTTHAAAPGPAAGDSNRHDTVAGPPTVATRADSHAATVTRTDTAAPRSATPFGPADSGSLRLTGLPPGTTVLVDGQPATKATMRLPSGPHEIAVSAPRYEFYIDTVQVPRDDLLEISPSLVPIGAALGGARPSRPALSQAVRNCEVPGPANRFGRDCYDEPPRPRNPTRLAVPAGSTATPSAPVFFVKVSADGKTLNAMVRTPSNDADFQRLAADYVLTMTWTPATRAGAPVVGWIQLVIQPL